MATATLVIGISSSVVTGTKTYVGTDADITALIAWASSTLSGSLPSNPTASQVLTAWANSVVQGVKGGVQQFQDVPPAPLTLS